MKEMTGYERTKAILERKPVDRIGLYEHFWGDTQKAYVKAGKVREDEDLIYHFDLDMTCCWAFNLVLDLDFKPEIIEEQEETVLVKDGNGAILRRHKEHDTTPEHVDFTIKDYDGWLAARDKIINFDPRRINFEGYREAKKKAKEHNKFFFWSGINVFECMHPVCGHENMLVGMALEPEWIEDMASLYADATVKMQEVLFEQEGYPDGIWYYEDMGFKEKPFMSPDMYRRMIMPSHKKTIDFAHSHNLPVVMHSCGYIEPLLPFMIEAGIDCLQVIEVKAGMDLLKLHKLYGDKICFMGGIDVRALYSNDKAVIDAELESKIPIVKEGFGYFLHSDHSIPCTVDYDTLQYYFKKGLELGKY